MDSGVDTHKRQHVLVAVDEQGRTAGRRTVGNTAAGWAAALQWTCLWPGPRRWGVEHSGALGKGFAQCRLAVGEAAVCEISAHRTAPYRRRSRSQDKTDDTDALAMARLLRAEVETVPQVQRDDVSTELRLRSDHRANLVVDRTRLIKQRHAQMLQLDPRSEEQRGPLTSAAGVRACLEVHVAGADRVVQTRRLVVRQLAARIQQVDAAIAALTRAMTERVRATARPLLGRPGVGAVIAARLLGELGCQPRIRSAAALAALAGIAPVAVSSGGRGGHRVTDGGNRQLNRTFHLIALGQRRCEPRATASDEKKRAAGTTAQAAMRCRKRRLVDVIYRLLREAIAEQAVVAA